MNLHIGKSSSYKAKECCRLLGSWVCHVLADSPGRYIPGIKCFRPIRSLVTLKFPAIDNIFHIFFCCQKLRGGGGGRPHDFLTRGGQCPLGPPPPGSAYGFSLYNMHFSKKHFIVMYWFLKL